MTEAVVQWFTGVPKEWTVFIISMLPIVELRGAIPYAMSSVGGPAMVWWQAYLICCLGNLVPLVPILVALGPVSNWLRRHSRLMERFFTWIFARTKRKGGAIERHGAWGLIIFVAIPLPVTGGWTGSAAAFLFGIPFRKALPCVMAGVAIAGVVVTGLTVLSIKGYHFIGF
jgi:uncharacterized membrane protein